ncbi:Deoxyribonuclease II family protein [Histomonas meleagridis]|uniref:Deoxyribonuclease II family protein n=1 Tax=Histomonas meleagridis TaxID=135588 RepID=UPI003559F624|nr:Deoxyribonuclease II family protein [Histomonas meleagridis]KAH0796412.1 Deoxyribonuclease II family protein [Histomonas meleagridis]
MLFSFLLCSAVSKLSCKNIKNQNVNWFAAFKVPKVSDGVSAHESGLGYFYRDSSTTLQEGPSDLSSKTSNPIYYSIASLYSGSSDIGYVLISDQPPSGKSVSGSRAHMKGVFLFDSSNGIYLLHSVPKFPPEPSSGYSFPASGTTYGQSFLCLTLSHSDMDKIMEILLVDFPYPYASSIPSYAYSSMPTLQKFMNEKWNNNDMTLVRTVKAGTTQFTLYGKHRKWGKDLYHDLLATSYQDNIYANTWSNGVGTNPSDCSGLFAAYNVLNLNWGSISWKRSKDHSKWGVIGSNVCIGDINRQESQKSRGGGAFCINDIQFSNEIHLLIDDYETC